MKRNFLEVLACPSCEGALNISVTEECDGEILKGDLICSCGKQYAIVRGIPRFVPSENYANSFGYQWNRFRLEQIDSLNQTNLSTERFFNETSWNLEFLKDKWILDAGCGAGRFLEVACRSEANVIGIDLSNAVDAAQETLKCHANLHLVQGSILNLPIKKEILDAIYCIGVIQHTPEPLQVFPSFSRVLKREGRLAVTIYEKKRWTLLNGKYLARMLLKKVPRPLLLTILKRTMPVLFPITDVLFRLPLLGKVAQFAIPVANYIDNKKLTRQQRYQWAIMDTFDMLAPVFDQPQTEKNVCGALVATNFIGIKRLPNDGLNIVGIKS